MVRFGTLAFDGVPRIAVPFRDGSFAPYIDDAVKRGVDIAELRIDEFSKHDTAHVLAEAAKFSALPVLATIRCAAEGGKWSDTDDRRLELYRAVLPHVQAVDVELSSAAILPSVVRDAHALDKPVVISFHDFTGTPDRATLERIALEARAAGADIVKVAGFCTRQADIQTLAAFTLDHAEDGVVVIGMGPIGVCTRVLFPALGSLFTFAALGQGTAPGQLQLAELKQLLGQIYPRAS
ncbi:MAG: type I 3-dehydroquinate dehydratase [Candidatus Hydrogenedentes bacterium]|nr:type I 3-dehydroquinate dehydratase [Candidatus Hydrogenedentota bacterium]